MSYVPASAAQVPAVLTFSEEFTGAALSLRNALPTTGVNRFRNSAMWPTKLAGALPENWTNAALPAGLTGSVVAINQVGTPYLDYRISGTATAAGTTNLYPEIFQAITTVSGDVWAFSVYLMRVAGTMTNVTGMKVNADIYTAASGYLTTFVASPTLGTTLARSFCTGTAPANSGIVWAYVGVTTAVGAVDITVRISAPQLEKAAAPTLWTSTTSNSGTWSTHYNDGTYFGGTGEQEYMVDTQIDGTSKSGGNNPFSVANSVLTITAAVAPASTSGGQPYTSGAINTWNGFSQTYGYYECMCRCPVGQGLWPAVWMLRNDKVVPSEIDIMEQLDAVMTVYYATTHSANLAGGQTQYNPTVTDTSVGFHSYGVEWTASAITYYRDRVVIGSHATPVDLIGNPMYLILQLAIGGTWGGAIVIASPSQLPARFDIDYMRVWDKRPF